jgi:hypothetical protein
MKDLKTEIKEVLYQEVFNQFPEVESLEIEIINIKLKENKKGNKMP